MKFLFLEYGSFQRIRLKPYIFFISLQNQVDPLKEHILETQCDTSDALSFALINRVETFLSCLAKMSGQNQADRNIAFGKRIASERVTGD